MKEWCDNAANMAFGCYSTQKKLLGNRKYAIRIQCARHMLNSISNVVIDCYLEAVNVLDVMLSY